MAVAASQRQPEYLRGLVDMGSNGIRFSISTLQPPTARIMPTLYQQRAAISLYDAQYSAAGERQPIDDATISHVVSSFQQFKQTCADFRVLPENITVLATEATRTAINSEDFRNQIKSRVGWDVIMLPKEEEGRVGAMGVASSLSEAGGLVMDLGGGSTQLSWIVKRHDSDGIKLPKNGAVSMPYGAAALSLRVAQAKEKGHLEELKKEIRQAVKSAYESLDVPEELEQQARDKGGFSLYLSGGGFRGWGYVLMSRHRVQPYPIPVINGFKVSRDEFLSTDTVKQAAVAALHEDDADEIFRVSDRRASQVPAVAVLVTALSEALPQISDVQFCQGGVREGYLYSSLIPEVRAQHPLVVATQPFDSPTSSERIVELLQAAIPSDLSSRAQDDCKSIFTPELLDSFANMMYYHSSHSKDLQAVSALRSTTTGILAGVHGVVHESRAMLGLLLCARWGDSLPPADDLFKRNLELHIGSSWTLWWINYVGAVAGLVSSLYPAGVVDPQDGRLHLKASWSRDHKERPQLVLHVNIASSVRLEAFTKEIKAVEKLGKRKRWVGGKEGCGYKVVVETTQASPAE